MIPQDAKDFITRNFAPADQDQAISVLPSSRMMIGIGTCRCSGIIAAILKASASAITDMTLATTHADRRLCFPSLTRSAWNASTVS